MVNKKKKYKDIYLSTKSFEQNEMKSLITFLTNFFIDHWD